MRILLSAACLATGFLAAFIFTVPVLTAQESEPIEVPELVALAWTVVSDTPTMNDVRFWDPAGKEITGEARHELLASLDVNSFQPAIPWQPQDGSLRPLLLVFSVDTRISNAGVLPEFTFADGRTMVSNSWEIMATNNYVVSSLGPGTRFTDWPAEAALEIRYSPGDPETIRHITENVDQKLELDDGLTSEFRSDESGTRFVVSQEYRETEERITATHDVIAVMHDGRRIDTNNLSVRIDPESGRRILEKRSRPMDPDWLEEIFVIRRQFAWQKTGDVRIRTDWLDSED